MNTQTLAVCQGHPLICTRFDDRLHELQRVGHHARQRLDGGRRRVLPMRPPTLLDPRSERLVLDAHRLGKRLRARAATMTLTDRSARRYAYCPDPTRYDELGDGWVNEYGPLWHARLRTDWMDAGLNLAEVAKNLGVIRKVVRRQATRWHLPFPKPGQRVTKRRSDRPPLWKGKRKTIYPQTMDEMRSQWLHVVANTDAKNLKAVAKMHGKVYSFLRRYDNSWIVEHPLRREKKTVKAPTVDWVARDEQIAQKVASAASALMMRPSKPVIISQLAICRQIGSPVGLYNLRSKMPKSSAVLDSAAETRSSFAVRRILWAAEEIKRKGLIVTEAKVILMAGSGVRRRLLDPVVKEALSDACRR